MKTGTCIGLLGGTFDPVHHGHLRLAIECREQLGLAAVRLVPNSLPPHRATPRSAPEHRLAMVACAVSAEAGLGVDPRELARTTPSFTVDTLEGLRQEQGDEQPLAWIIGLDAFLGLPAWHRWQELLDFAHLVIAHRPGYHFDPESHPVLDALLEQAQTEHAADLHHQPAGRVFFLPVPQLDISSTAIRRAVAHGRSVRYLTPDSVIDYFTQHGLYC